MQSFTITIPDACITDVVAISRRDERSKGDVSDKSTDDQVIRAYLTGVVKDAILNRRKELAVIATNDAITAALALAVDDVAGIE